MSKSALPRVFVAPKIFIEVMINNEAIIYDVDTAKELQKRLAEALANLPGGEPLTDQDSDIVSAVP